jgi:hypothetical protein
MVKKSPFNDTVSANGDKKQKPLKSQTNKSAKGM